MYYWDIYAEKFLELPDNVSHDTVEFVEVPLFGDRVTEDFIRMCRFNAWKKIGIKFTKEEWENTSKVHQDILYRIEQLIPQKDFEREDLQTINGDFLDSVIRYKNYSD